MDTLHQSNYDINLATSRLVPRGPVLCADELEAWTQEEAKRFEDGLQEQKDFLYIQRKYVNRPFDRWCALCHDGVGGGGIL